MTPEEKNKKVLEGSDVEIGIATILQNTDFAKEVEVKESNSVEETSEENKTLEQVYPLNTDFNQINASLEATNIPSQEITFPISSEEAITREPSSNADVFDNVYNANDIKIQATVVTEEDEKNAKNAYMQIQEKMYDNGPGSQIKTLRNFSEEAAKWMRIVDKSGFVSGEMHDLAKKILREYEGLAPEENSFADKEQNEMVQADPYGNIIPLNSYDSNNQKAA